jgi:peptidoglycan/LPS O-acetylase OafA/YrhL
VSGVPLNPGSTPQPPPVTFEHRPSLDGLRAVAALLVLLFHAGTPGLGFGYTGVDVFFVLSGFLITSLLCSELVETGRLRFVSFYARRVRRLLPAALAVLLLTAVAYEVVASPAAVAEARGGFVASAAYIANWYFLNQSHDYFAQEAHPSPVEHYWSLSVEEQFYLVWPLVLLAVFLFARRVGLRLDVVAAGIALIGLVYAGILAASDPMASYFGTGARAYQLLIGATVALYCLRRKRPAARRSDLPQPPGAAALAAAGLAVLLVAGTPLLGSTSAFWHGVASAAGTALLIFGLELAPGSRAGRVLAWGPARAVGRWSYAAYLWHWPVIVLGDELGLLPQAWPIRTALVVAVTLLLSAATFRFIEQPARRISLRTFPRQRLVALSGVAVAAVAAFAFPAVLQVDARAQALIDEANAGTSDLASVRQTRSGAPTVLLVGDSHAEVLHPAFARLAKEQGWALLDVLEWACPWSRVQATLNGAVLECESMRKRALRIAEKEHPEIVVLVSRSIVKRPLVINGAVVDPGGPGWLEEVSRGTESFLADLKPLVGRVVVVEPLPETAEPMIDCLSTGADPDSCSLPAVSQPGTDVVEAVWESLPGVTTISIDDLICPLGTCPAMVNGIPTHRDSHHLAGSYARYLAHPLDAYLRARGIVLDEGEVKAL